MPIVPSRAREIKELVAALADGRAARREAALARITLLGERCVPQLLEALRSPAAALRLGVLGALERLGGARVLPEIAALLGDADDDLAIRASQVLATLVDPRGAKALRKALRSGRPAVARAAAEALARLHESGVVEALEALLDVLFDEKAEDDLRLVALAPVARLPARERTPLLKRLGGTRSARLASAAADPAGAPPPTGVAAIPALHREIERLSAADARGKSPASVAEAKARVHLDLARLDSRIALYDLREMLEARPLRSAGDLLQAAALIGDKTLVPILARLAAEEPGLLAPCAEAFGAIVRRASLRRTSAAMRAVKAEHQTALARLWIACGSPSR